MANLFEEVAKAQEAVEGVFNAKTARLAQKNLVEAGFVQADAKRVGIALMGFLEHVSPEAAKAVAGNPDQYAQDFLDMLAEVPSE